MNKELSGCQEIKQEGGTYRVDMQCAKCDGMMRSTGICLTSMPPIYPHKCNKCGYEESFGICYPSTEFSND